MNSWLWDSLGWTDVLDIGILSFILYRTLKVLQGSRALQILLGLAFILLLFLVSEQLGLTSIHWLLEELLVYIVLAVIILFQADIRRGLARAGGILPSFRSATEVSMLEELTKASFTLASRRMGALIAIERAANLDEFIDPATQLDAQVSHELLQAVFHPTSPLHDGAVVIRDGRLAAAQVFLPLSLSKEVSRFYGTRHRAALGLTEETDAIVLIVSEERGSVSVVQDGQITPTSDANELRERLQSIFATHEPTEARPEEELTLAEGADGDVAAEEEVADAQV
jgi:diadenylate cyclase